MHKSLVSEGGERESEVEVVVAWWEGTGKEETERQGTGLRTCDPTRITEDATDSATEEGGEGTEEGTGVQTYEVPARAWHSHMHARTAVRDAIFFTPTSTTTRFSNNTLETMRKPKTSSFRGN